MGIEEEVEKLLREAKEKGSVFLVSLTPKELEDAGFVYDDDDDFEDVGYKVVDIFLVYDNEFKLRYVFDHDEKSAEVDTEKDFYGLDLMKYAIKLYLEAKKQ